MISSISGSQFMPHAVMNGSTQRINRAASEEASESPSTRIAEAQERVAGQSNQLSQSGMNGHIGQKLDVRA